LSLTDEGHLDGNGHAVTPDLFGGAWGHQMSVVRGLHETANRLLKHSNMFGRML
jgi:hypothetical protein